MTAYTPSLELPASHEGRALLDLTVLIITFNEAAHIERAIASVRSFAREVVVVDSFSTDGTVEMARAAGARVLQNKFINHSRQFQWGLDHGEITSEWILRLDADEVIESDLQAEFLDRIPALPADVVGINLDRKHLFMGAWIRHGGRFPLRLLRVWRREHGRVEDRWMDEHIVIWGGQTVAFKGGFSDWNTYDLTFFTDKHNKYATREAIEKLNQKYGLFSRDEAFSAAAGPRQAVFKRWFKEAVYNRLPFWFAPLGYFLYRYTVQLGFLDGWQGLIYHVLQGFWYRFLVEAKTLELDAAIADCTDNAQRIARLSSLTKLSLG